MVQAFIENYPEFKKLSGTVSKHVAVVGELSRVVADHKVMVVSECEQDIVTASDRNVFKVTCTHITQHTHSLTHKERESPHSLTHTHTGPWSHPSIDDSGILG